MARSQVAMRTATPGALTLTASATQPANREVLSQASATILSLPACHSSTTQKMSGGRQWADCSMGWRMPKEPLEKPIQRYGSTFVSPNRAVYSRMVMVH